MDSENIEKVVFYSWQSDLPSAGNHYLIRDSLREAIKRIGRDDIDLKIRIDYDTLGEPGSPDIKEVIFNKIDQCSVFICDVSIINNRTESPRKTPNPNVLIELGYAAARLGWEKIILVFNEHYGKREDLPFDIRGHRQSVYSLNSSNAPKEERNKAEEYLADLFTVAVKSILAAKDTKSFDQSSDEIKRSRDIKTIKRFLYSIYIPEIEKFFELAKEGITTMEIFTVLASMGSVIPSTTFYLYDKNLMDTILSFYNNLHSSLSFGNLFAPDGHRYLLIKPHPQDNKKQWEIDYSNFLFSVCAAENDFRIIIQCIHENYIEIDVSAITKEVAEALKSEPKA